MKNNVHNILRVAPIEIIKNKLYVAVIRVRKGDKVVTEVAAVVYPEYDSAEETVLKAVGSDIGGHIIPYSFLRDIVDRDLSRYSDKEAGVAVETFAGGKGDRMARFFFLVGKAEFVHVVTTKKVVEALSVCDRLMIPAMMIGLAADLYETPGVSGQRGRDSKGRAAVEFSDDVCDAIDALKAALRKEIATEKSEAGGGDRKSPRVDNRPRISVKDLSAQLKVTEEELRKVLPQANANPNREGMVLVSVVERIKAHLNHQSKPTVASASTVDNPAAASSAAESVPASETAGVTMEASLASAAKASVDESASEPEVRVKLRDLAMKNKVQLAEVLKAAKACGIIPKPADMSVTAADGERIEGKILKDLEARTAPKKADRPYTPKEDRTGFAALASMRGNVPDGSTTE